MDHWLGSHAPRYEAPCNVLVPVTCDHVRRLPGPCPPPAGGADNEQQAVWVALQAGRPPPVYPRHIHVRRLPPGVACHPISWDHVNVSIFREAGTPVTGTRAGRWVCSSPGGQTPPGTWPGWSAGASGVGSGTSPGSWSDWPSTNSGYSGMSLDAETSETRVQRWRTSQFVQRIFTINKSHSSQQSHLVLYTNITITSTRIIIQSSKESDGGEYHNINSLGFTQEVFNHDKQGTSGMMKIASSGF